MASTIVTNVTVNGRPLKVWIDEEQGNEIQDFYLSELRGMRRVSRRPILSSAPIRNASRPVATTNGSLRFV